MGDEFVPTHPERDTVTITGPGMDPIHTTVDGMKRATKRMKETAAEPRSTRFAADQLRALVERIIHLEDEKKTFADDIKEVYGEAKSTGFDTKALRRVVRLQRMDQSQKAAHAEVETILETYMQALGML